MSDSLDVSKHDSFAEFRASAQTVLDEIKNFVVQLAQDLKNEPFAYEVVAGGCRQFIQDHTGSKEDCFDIERWPDDIKSFCGYEDCPRFLYALSAKDWTSPFLDGEYWSRRITILVNMFELPLEWLSWRGGQALQAFLRTLPIFAMDADTSVRKHQLREELLNHCTEVIELLELETEPSLIENALTATRGAAVSWSKHIKLKDLRGDLGISHNKLKKLLVFGSQPIEGRIRYIADEPTSRIVQVAIDDLPAKLKPKYRPDD